MTGDETIAYSEGGYLRCFLDPNGADRDFDPEAGFPEKFEMVIINLGNYGITFDSTGLAQVVGPGEKIRFYFDGSNWI